MTDGARQRSSTSGSAKDAAGEKESGGGVALKKEIGLVSACGIIVGKSVLLPFLLEPDLPYGVTSPLTNPIIIQLPPLFSAAILPLNSLQLIRASENVRKVYLSVSVTEIRQTGRRKSVCAATCVSVRKS